jgi:gamma-glutamyltranspeptidase/glutathione hydrolase
MADFASYSPVESDPIALECGGYELHTPPLPSGGVTSLQIVRAMHEADPPLPPLGKGGQWGGQADYYHLLIEISKLAWLDRIHECGDPAFIDDPTWRLLGSAHTIDLIASAGLAEPSGAPVGAPGPAGCTVHTVAADAGGNFVSLTATQGGRFGSRVVIDGLGLIVGHGMSRFDPVPGRPNSIAPGKRVLHNMSPMILTRGGEIAGAFGLPGGRKIVNVAAQMALSFVEFGLTPSQAVNAPRIHTEGREPVTVTGLSPEVIESLTSRGHRIESIQGRIGGPACAIMLDRETGCLLAASERGPGCVAVVV